ncbi:OLC1v1018484C1 [Oldenlandia corymbosa var. corymbosa]|uniref:non-specific serine/threonine protein kinase n=1 Tax=Oldenlandia corymbosa var. corymbosa TaxID=529605 RepID=A0AAV1EBQ3_OLDCO|nr:OLC1v1018484C1 [Oldenlandia corymbosa var. corymbosa]
MDAGNIFQEPLPKAFSSKTLYYIRTILSKFVIIDLYLFGNPQNSHIDDKLMSIVSSLNYEGNRGIPPLYLGSNGLKGLLPEWAYNWSNGISNETISSDKNLFSCCSNSRDMKNKWLANDFRCENEDKGSRWWRITEIYMNCGGNATKDEQGKEYEAYNMNPNGKSSFVMSKNRSWGYSSLGSFRFAPTNKYTLIQTCNITLPDAPLYAGARVAPISLTYYGFCLRNDAYNVRLDFAELGNTVLRDFNIAQQAGGIFNFQEGLVTLGRFIRGHMPPEYMLGLPLTPKADVYSFGLVTLEIISGVPLIMVKPKKEDIHLLNGVKSFFLFFFYGRLCRKSSKFWKGKRDGSRAANVSTLHL